MPLKFYCNYLFHLFYITLFYFIFVLLYWMTPLRTINRVKAGMALRCQDCTFICNNIFLRIILIAFPFVNVDHLLVSLIHVLDLLHYWIVLGF